MTVNSAAESRTRSLPSEPEARRVVEIRRSLNLNDPNPETAAGQRVLVWLEGVVVSETMRTNPDGTVVHVCVVDPDRAVSLVIVNAGAQSESA